MHAGFRPFLGAFTVLLLALVPAVLPVPDAVEPAMATGAELDKYLLLPDTSDASNAEWDGVTADGEVIPDGTDFTVEAWVYPDSLNNPSVWHQILQQSGDSASNYGRFGLNLKTSGNDSTLGYAGVQVIYDGVNLDTNSQAPDVKVFEDRWTHIAVSVEASAGEVTLFLNGAEVHSYNSGLDGTADVRADGFTVGYFPFSDGTDRHFHGGIDQVKVWDGLLLESQVQQSMSSFDDTGVTSAPTLRALLDFNEDYADSQGAFTFATAGTVSRTELAQTVTGSSDTVITFPRSYLTSVGGWTVPAGVTSLDVLVVGGGGGGGVGYSFVHGGGGGGAGGFREETITPSSSTVQVVVGAGGSGGAPANPGGGSSIDTVSVAGGGRGGSYDDDAGSGGSGGGGGHSGGGRASTSGAAATNASYGNSGGSASGNGYSSKYAGGGGGAGGAGSDSADGGTGGLGKASTITGSEVYYAGGGGAGGGQGASARSAGGSAVGGSGGFATIANVLDRDGTNGVPNRGGGGGGGAGYNFSGSSGSGNGGAGGSGVVIIRYSPVSTPDAPGNLSAVTSDGQVDLSWTAPTYTGDSAIAGYLVEYRVDSGSWQTYNDGVTTTSATLTGLTDTSTYEFRVSATNANSNTGTGATITVSPELEPSFGAFGGTSDGFTVVIDNYDGTYTWSASATNGASVSISGAGVATVTGLDPGETSAVTVTATKTNTFPGSATATGTAALVVDLDAANSSSYAGTGSTWTNLVDGTNYTIVSGSFSNVQGGAIDFNGSSTYVDLSTPLSANSNFTFEAWVFDEGSTGSRNILSSYDTPLFVGGTTLYGGLESTWRLIESSNFPQDAWRHVVLTWDDPSNRMRLFVNGVEEANLLTSTRHFTEQSIFVGAHPSGGGASFWDGLIAKARVYNEAVSTTQVLARYNATRSTYGLGQALNPTSATPTKTADGYTVQISNYDSDFTWSASPSSGSATINGTGLVTVTGLSTGESSTVTVTSTRTGYDQGSATVTSTALDEHTVTFNKGSVSGVSGENQTATKIYGTDLTLPDSSTANGDFTRTGYYVAGWSENADGSTTDYSLGGAYTADAADTLYPVWEPNYCVPASGDSYVNSGSGRSTTVYGLGGHLLLKNASSSTSNSYNRVTYLEFDYDSDDTWDGAQLEVTVTGNNQGNGSSFWSSADPFELKVFGVNSASWDESTLTFTSANASSDGWGLNTGTWPWQPDSGELLGTIDIPTLSTTVGQTYGLSSDALDSFLNDDADGEVTFFLVRSDTDGQSNLSLASRENTSYAAPTLRPVKESTSCAYSVTYSKGSVSGAAGSDQSGIKVEGSDVTLPGSATADSYFTKSGYSVSAWSTRADGTTSDFSLAGTYSTDAAATLYPVWEPDVYTVTYNYDGATGGNSTALEEYTYDGAAIGLPSPTKSGYTFGGWYSDSDLTTSVGAGGASYTPTADINLYAEWTAGTYTVLYAYNRATAGNSTTSETYSTGGTDITLPTPTRTGYTFGGWYSDLELTSQVGVAGDAYSPTLNLTLYAKWIGEPRSVTYMNPESLTGSVPTDSTDYIIGDTVVVKLNSGSLQKNGYAFEGWTENSDGTGTVLEPGATLSVSTTDIELYPKWSAVTYSISYNKNGGTGDLSAAPTSWQTGGSNVTLPNTGLTKTGYTFDGWEELGSSVKESYDYFPNYADTTLVARWTINNISYSFAQGEAVGLTISGWPSNSSANFGTSITLPDLSGTTVTIGGTQHLFVAWEESGTTYDSGESFVLGDTAPTFTAEWAELYDVRYVFGGGTHSLAGDGAAECDTNSLCEDGEPVSLRSAPERPGYTFTGWTDQSGGEFEAGETVNISSTSYLFYAQWTAITYRFSFNSLGGSANPARQDKTIGQLVTMPSAGSRTGYTFGGWSADGGSTVYIDGSTFVVGTEALSFSAQWVPDDYTISYDWTGGSSATPDVSDTYTVGTGYMTLPTASGASYTRDGYTFSGWSTTPDGSLITNYLPTADDVLYAVWADGTYEITYNAYGGIPTSSQAFVIRTESVTLPTPVRSDFTFIGWFDAETGGNLVGAGGSSFQPEASQTLYARWVQDSLYGVDLATLESATTYEASSSTGTTMTVTHTPSSSSASVAVPAGALPDGTVVTVRYFKDTTRQSELIPDDNSYFFALLVSWLQGSGSTATVPTTAEGKPITVTLNNSNIKAGAMVYQVIGGTVTELGRATVDGSIEVELTEDPEIVVAATKPNAPTSVSGSAGDTAVTVSWTAASNGGSAITGYTVTASPGGQTCSTTTTSCTIRSLTNNTGYTFQVTAQNGLGSSSPSSRSSAVTPGGANYTVTFNSNGGSAVPDGSFFSGANVSAPSSPTLSGFDFAGWTTVPDDDSSEVAFPYTPGVTQNIVLYALWEEAPEPAGSQGNDAEESSSGGSTQTARRPIVPGAPGRPAITNPGAVTPGGRLPAPTSPDGLDTTKDSAQVVVGGRPVETESSRRGPSGVGVSAGNIDLGLRVDPGSSKSGVVTNPATGSAEIVVGAGESTALNARGFRPNSTVRVSIPGAERDELAQINVDADGSVQGDVRVARNAGEQPIPVGRQIMEIAGLDADGNDTRIEVVINVVQGDPAPERLRDTNEIPSLSPGVSLATSAGVPEQVEIQVRPEQRQVAVLSGDWSFEVTVEEETGTVADESGTPAVRLFQEKTADVSGSGFQPDSRVDVWLFSDPTLLGSVMVSADGSFSTEFYLDPNYATPGDHTLQLQGVGSDGFIKAANLGVEIVQPLTQITDSSTLSLLWWVLVAAVILALTVIFGLARRRAVR